MLKVSVDQLFFWNNAFVVLLKSEEDPRCLPIFIGAAEAQAIALHMNGVAMPRPLTHDLLKNVLDFLECRLKRVEICDLLESTFYARLILEKDGVESVMDSRPSDAIALALRMSSPIYVGRNVMDEAGKELDSPPESGDHHEEIHRAAHEAKQEKKMTPLDVLGVKLEKAVEEERYEDAAKLRDEINRLQNTHADN